MAKNTQTIEHVTFGNRGRRWDFKAEKDGKEVYSYSTPLLHGGAETARKVANIINGAIKRGGMDNLARANMSTIFHKAAKAKSRMVTHLGTFA